MDTAGIDVSILSVVTPATQALTARNGQCPVLAGCGESAQQAPEVPGDNRAVSASRTWPLRIGKISSCFHRQI
jgi:hypothetical protein